MGRRPGLHFPAGRAPNYGCRREVQRRWRRRSRREGGRPAGASRFEWLRARALGSPEDPPHRCALCRREATNRRRPRLPLRRRRPQMRRRRTMPRRRTPRNRPGRRPLRHSSGLTSCAAAWTWTRRRGPRPGRATGAWARATRWRCARGGDQRLAGPRGPAPPRGMGALLSPARAPRGGLPPTPPGQPRLPRSPSLEREGSPFCSLSSWKPGFWKALSGPKSELCLGALPSSVPKGEQPLPWTSTSRLRSCWGLITKIQPSGWPTEQVQLSGPYSKGMGVGGLPALAL